MLFRQGGADRLQVFAGIEALRNVADVLAQRFAIAQEYRAREHVHLAARVVDVVFARHIEAGEHQEIGEHVAEHRAAAMADVHGAGRVGGDVLDVDRLAFADGRPSIGGARIEDGAHQAVPHLGLQREIEEARPGDGDSVNAFGARELRLQLVGDVARLHARGLGQHHRRIGRQVAVGRIARRLHLDAGRRHIGRQLALGLQRIERCRNAIFDLCEHVHGGDPEG